MKGVESYVISVFECSTQDLVVGLNFMIEMVEIQTH